MRATTVSIGTVLPTGTRILRKKPRAVASTSRVALSDSKTKRRSPRSTGSPSFLTHSMMVPSSIVCPILGRITSVTIAYSTF